LKAGGPGSCVTGTVARPAVLDMVIVSSGERRHRIRSAVRQLSFLRGTSSEDADAMLAAREAACAHRSTNAPDGTELAAELGRRPRLESVQTAGFSPQTQRLWNFDRTTELELVEELLFQLAEFVGVKSLPQACVKALVERVASCYQENTYHCFTHACDVTISAFVLLTKYGGAEYLCPIDSITLVVSALMHDVGHPGNTNAFEKQTQSEIVRAYGEDGTYERMHLDVAKRILSSADCNIFKAAGFSEEEQLWALDLLEYVVLGTDLSIHFNVMHEWQAMFARTTAVEGGNRDGKGEVAQASCLQEGDLNEEMRKALVRMMMKASDLGCCAKPWPVARHWGERLVEESRRHEQDESARGMTTSTAAIPTGSVTHTSQHQLNFHLKIVNPIFAAVVDVLPPFQIGMAQALHNTENWKRMAEGEEPVAVPDL